MLKIVASAKTFRVDCSGYSSPETVAEIEVSTSDGMVLLSSRIVDPAGSNRAAVVHVLAPREAEELSAEITAAARTALNAS